MNRRILVIEDNNSLRLLLHSMLEHSFAVTSKKDGLDALAWLSLGHLPDFILLDINMPQLNGMELMAHLRNNGFYRHIPIVILSGENNAGIRKQCMELGAQAYFTKPFEPEVLKKTLQELDVQAV